MNRRTRAIARMDQRNVIGSELGNNPDEHRENPGWRRILYHVSTDCSNSRELTKPLDRERRGIGEWRFAGHHLRQQAARHRPKRQAVMLMAEVEPQAAMAGALPMMGSMSGRHGRAPFHGWASTGSPSGNSARAFGSASSTCTGLGGASRRANSTPVVRRMPRNSSAPDKTRGRYRARDGSERRCLWPRDANDNRA